MNVSPVGGKCAQKSLFDGVYRQPRGEPHCPQGYEVFLMPSLDCAKMKRRGITPIHYIAGTDHDEVSGEPE